jgi:hypothetical protein
MEDRDRNYADECGDHGGTNSDGDPCGRAAGWGTEFDSGKCRQHRGTSPDGSSHEGNRHAVDHGLYSDSNLYYQKECDDAGRALIDEIYADYHEKYVEQHGEPPTGDDARLFKIAVNIHKELRADDWAVERPAGLESGHPLVDRSEKRTAQGKAYYEYVETAVAKAEARLSQRTRMWLKDLGLLEDPDSENAQSRRELADAVREALDS